MAIARTGIVVLAAVAGGFWLRAALSLDLVGKNDPAMASKPISAATATPSAALPLDPDGRGTLLFYRDPMGLAEISLTPKRDGMGMDYVPIYSGDGPANGHGRILFYRNPMGEPEISPEPKKDGMGMDYIPVFERHATSADGQPAEPPSEHPHETASNKASKDEREILYYRHPMGLPDISPEPKKDSMGMDYIPVYADEASDAGGTVKVSLEKVQRLGVVTEHAQLRGRLVRTVHAVGAISLDERRRTAVTTKIEGWVEKLHLNTTGQAVRKGEPILEIYSPELLLAQQEWVIARQALEGARAQGDAAAIDSAERLVEGALQRLRYWDISEDQLDRLGREGVAQRRFILHSPADGQVMEKRVIEGMRVMPGEPLFELVDLSTVWVVAEVFEQELRLIETGQHATVSVTAYPGEAFEGTVSFIYPAVDPETRTGKIRIETPNPGGRLKQHMYASVALTATAVEGQVVTVPESALLHRGERQVVLVEQGQGRFEPREVATGTSAEGLVEITEGLSAGEKVVVRANFLIDAESNLQAALRAFTAPAAHETSGAPTPPSPQMPKPQTPASAGHVVVN